jgi:hypothetical protein
MTMLADPHIQTQASAVYTTEIEDPDFKINLAVNNEARVLVFHNRHFRKKLSWLEFDLNRNRLDFVMNDGDVRNFGIPVAPDMAKYMQNAFQVMMVLMNEETGEPEGGNYFPLIIHRT